MRIGLFGGTFNPVHSGHVQVALDIRERFALDRIYYIPSAIPPHKDPEHVAPAEMRFAMVKLAVSGHEGLLVSDLELRRQGLSYSIHTVESFRAEYPEQTEIFFLLGIDAFLEINTWKFWRRLFRLCSFIIIPRPGRWMSHRGEGIITIERYLNKFISKHYSYNEHRRCFVHDEMQPVYLSDSGMVDISSTKIRNAVKKGGKVSRMLPLPVERYIKVRGLYK